MDLGDTSRCVAWSEGVHIKWATASDVQVDGITWAQRRSVAPGGAAFVDQVVPGGDKVVMRWCQAVTCW